MGEDRIVALSAKVHSWAPNVCNREFSLSLFSLHMNRQSASLKEFFLSLDNLRREKGGFAAFSARSSSGAVLLPTEADSDCCQ